ncbi:hypothetical protein HBI56_028970 [Parastagonospora nodorum]|nr:hypothetical protein HBH53_030260 [Parastagonospora nodorum]KAH3969188.1 hypothetical protein HBH51_122410 [Parastagonospora nodorum]KAH3990446.1 hypothetical protein HBH52_007250 [Parastagonospora nodorum]KAH4006761.1 hypothetical protein HBI10_017680 [Parastagonospora nodorum]KAH4015444.1 hypothetical protein HBI13_162950 [Parastagonospora nodorum]
MDEYEEAILFTFGELESRLDRLEYILGGPEGVSEEKPKTIPDRIHQIEKSLQTLGAQTSLLADAKELLSKHKDVLKPQDDYAKDVPLDTSQKAALVVERATGFATVASQLKALDDQQIPATDGFTKLAMLRPRIAEFEERQLQQALKISELRRRNGMINMSYKHIHILGAARVWVDYHQRLTEAMKAVEREEFKRKPDDAEAGAAEEHGSESEDEESEDEEL